MYSLNLFLQLKTKSPVIPIRPDRISMRFSEYPNTISGKISTYPVHPFLCGYIDIKAKMIILYILLLWQTSLALLTVPGLSRENSTTTSRPGSAMSGRGGAASNGGPVRLRSAPPRRPRPLSIATTGMTSSMYEERQKPQTPIRQKSCTYPYCLLSYCKQHTKKIKCNMAPL